MEETTATTEDPFRINVKETAKGFAYFDVTARGDTKEEVSRRLDEAIEIAEKKCKEINDSVQKEETK